MTEKEVIKMLECCSSDENVCDECPMEYERRANPFFSGREKEALNLIRLLQKENRALIAENRKLHGLNAQLSYDFELLKQEKNYVENAAIEGFGENLKVIIFDAIRLIGETKKEAEIGAVREFVKTFSYIERKEAPALPFTMSALDGVKQIITNLAKGIIEGETNV